MNTDVRKLHDLIEREEKDPLGIEATRTIARQICDTVRDPKMHPSIPMKAARAVAEHRLPPSELAEALDSVIAARATGDLRNPGGYFVTILKRLFQRHEIPWRY